jgi:hypothetical protein
VRIRTCDRKMLAEKKHVMAVESLTIVMSCDVIRCSETCWVGIHAPLQISALYTTSGRIAVELDYEAR